MSKLAMALGFLYVALGATLAVFPEWFLSVVDWPSRHGLNVAAGIRAVLGIVLLLAAPTSRFPVVFRVIGALALAGGLLLPFAPIDLWGEFIRWWIVDQYTLFRVALGIAATLFGAFIVYAAAPRVATA